MKMVDSINGDDYDYYYPFMTVMTSKPVMNLIMITTMLDENA